MGIRSGAAVLLLVLASGEEKNPDAAVLRRIENLRARAAKLKVDGKGRDWEGFPSFEDRDARPCPNASLDIRRIAVAPREEDLLVLVETAGPPSRALLPFGLDIDFTGRSGRDARVQFGANGVVVANAYPEGGSPSSVTFRRTEVSVGEVVEIAIPLSPVARALGEAGRAWLEGDRRSFVRVQSFTSVDGVAGFFDTGPSAASFRLVAPPLLLDPPLPPEADPRRAVRVPLEGTWFVRQGAQGLWSHAGLWAYDLAVQDHACNPTPVAGSRELGEYYSYDRPVVAPEGGTVVFDSARAVDRPPLEAGVGKDSGNTLIIRLFDGMRLSFGHLKSGSLAFPRGAEFPAGAELARVGNSGDSGAPHLHLSLHEKPGEFVGLPLAFRDVRVGLNPGPDDPWARDLPAWAIREGWFVTAR
jgi:hypothetical protein